MRPSAKPRLMPRARASASGRVGRGGGDLQQRLVAQQALARDVHPLRLALAPRGASAAPCPRKRRLLLRGRSRSHIVSGSARYSAGIGKFRHLLGHPFQPAVLFQSRAQPGVDRAEIGDIGGGVGDLRGRQRPRRPVAEPVRLVDRAAGQRRDQRVVADLLAEPRHHGGDLGVEQRPRHVAEAEDEDLDVLPRGVEHLHHRLVGEQFAERGEVDVRRLRIDHRDLVFAGKLHDAELRPVGALAHEFGIDGDELFRREPVAEGLEGFGGGDQGRWRESDTRRARHTVLVHGGGGSSTCRLGDRCREARAQSGGRQAACYQHDARGPFRLHRHDRDTPADAARDARPATRSAGHRRAARPRPSAAARCRRAATAPIPASVAVPPTRSAGRGAAPPSRSRRHGGTADADGHDGRRFPAAAAIVPAARCPARDRTRRRHRRHRRRRGAAARWRSARRCASWSPKSAPGWRDRSW